MCFKDFKMAILSVFFIYLINLERGVSACNTYHTHHNYNTTLSVVVSDCDDLCTHNVGDNDVLYSDRKQRHIETPTCQNSTKKETFKKLSYKMTSKGLMVPEKAAGALVYAIQLKKSYIITGIAETMKAISEEKVINILLDKNIAINYYILESADGKKREAYIKDSELEKYVDENERIIFCKHAFEHIIETRNIQLPSVILTDSSHSNVEYRFLHSTDGLAAFLKQNQ